MATPTTTTSTLASSAGKGGALEHPAKTSMALVEKRKAGTNGTACNVITNLFTLEVAKNMPYFKYDVDINAIFKKAAGGEARIPLSKLAKGEWSEAERKVSCTQAVQWLVDNKIIKEVHGYDKAACLYSATRIDGVETTPTTIIIPAKVLPEQRNADRIELIIKAVDTEDFQVNTDDLNKAGEVLNILTSRHAYLSSSFHTHRNRNHYLTDPEAYGFANEDFKEGVVLVPGIDKAVKVVEGTTPGKKVAVLLCDVVKTAQHVSEPLLEKITDLYGSNISPRNSVMLSKSLKGLQCIATHTGVTVTIGAFSPIEVGQITIQRNGKTITLPTYFQQQYGITLRHTRLPAVKDQRTHAMYPVELLKIAPHQNVAKHQESADLLRAIIKASAIPPQLRQQQTARLLEALDLSSEAQKKTGVYMKKGAKPIVVTGRVLPTVKVVFGDKTVEDGPSWSGQVKNKGPRGPSSHLFLPATIDKWAIILVDRGYNKDAKEEFIWDYKETVMRTAAELGMKMKQPIMMKTFNANGQEIGEIYREAMEEAKSLGCSYMMAVCDGNIKGHQILKELECEFEITTQEVQLAKARQAKRDTMRNLLYKTNSKCGGVAHTVATDNTDLLAHPYALICAYSILQPRWDNGDESDDPVIIGFAANCGDVAPSNSQEARMIAQSQYFMARYAFASRSKKNKERMEPREDSFEKVLENLIAEACRTFKEKRGKPPQRIYIFRGDANSHILEKIAAEELAIVKAACFQVGKNFFKPAISIIGVARSDIRLFPEFGEGDKNGNLYPGICLDSVVVSPHLNEFIIVSHKALQGTAKPTRYTIMVEHQFLQEPPTIEAYEKLCWQLTHLHDVNNSTTSLPTPSYVAEEALKRAQKQLPLLNRNRHPSPAQLNDVAPKLSKRFHA